MSREALLGTHRNFFPELYNIEHKPRSTRSYYLGVWLEFRDSERLQV